MEFAFIGSPIDMAVVMIVALVVFGPKRLPEVGRQLGGFMRDFRKTISSFTDAVEDTRSEFHSVINPTPGPYPPRLESTVPEHPEPPVAGQPLMRPYDQLEPDSDTKHEVVSGSISQATGLEHGAPTIAAGSADDQKAEDSQHVSGSGAGSPR